MTKSLAFLGKINSIHKNTLSPIRGVNRNLITTMNIPPLNGLDIGIPLNIIDNVFTNLHYGEDITTPKVILLQFLIGYYTYGKDRYKDALEYYDKINSVNCSLDNRPSLTKLVPFSRINTVAGIESTLYLLASPDLSLSISIE